MSWHAPAAGSRCAQPATARPCRRLGRSPYGPHTSPSPPALQDADSFGIFYASDADPVRLRPIDLLRADAGSATPVANPVLTPAQLGVAAIAEPQLLPMDGADPRLFMFFAALPCGDDARWGIAAVHSKDGGLSWQAPTWVLREPGVDLRAPIVFGHNGHVSQELVFWGCMHCCTAAGQPVALH